ncbi:filamentous hemagglutinin N-terminal domain-containing protein (plasmid) [Anabaena sp. FACHB-709]|uniref:Filamentous haemagglutinin FhaB/tRNA nuclease CdiA-like TPS domain-containing protein n=2 Tax=Nostocaceae TaxID=1162 RepID=A0A1Z4KUN7_ANAVA|nr:MULTISPECIES: filamentous hemagglutinin N-terminal domain-containing protein [Nostocaceae]BAY72736.1 hypothetical protein NIES23_55640 [Trichormus variabilis NIES-23]MBD2174961.1 filamentous hemagglutinin N-terminal domain-containing protein [Anabaena cylindrica FACHB-318]MBD2266715.1 filamentous hemagglutinin N-terminal domain-containing protein [Anabaena sp. FACHB-709]MBD2276361.1 filamentous hemagglutinin N-terminal domain-containing protein [Nostoc sp. PCC 7120 = FACHB-418]MBD2286910.1 
MINQFYFQWWWRLGLFLGLTCTTNLKALAQVTADQTLGTQVTDIGLYSVIQGGTTVGNTNLFHSFGSFNIPNGGAAIFLNDPNLTNIFARVTGGTPSDIQGLIYAQGTTNLFLMNPNGIIFGRNAQLNVGGSFVATTANAIQFPGGAEFSLTSSVPSGNTLLSVNPTAFLFNQIANQGANSIENRGSLQVSDNKSLILLGGNVAPTPDASGQILMDGGIIEALGGRVEIGGLTAPGSVGLQVNDDNLSLAFPNGVARTDISLINNSNVATFVLGTEGDDIVFHAHNFNLLNFSSLQTFLISNQGNPETKTSDISINATGIVTIAESSFIGNVSLGLGNSGNINIVGQSLKLINSGWLIINSQQGNSGIINVIVDDTIALSGKNADFPSSLIFSDGGINIQARNLSLADGSFINSVSIRNLLLADGVLTNPNNLFVGNSGEIKIQATDYISLNESSITARTIGEGNAGNLSIITNRLSLDNNSSITSDTSGEGNAGNLSIITNRLNLDNNSIITSGSSGSGNGSNLNINARDIFLNQSYISTTSLMGLGISNVGNAGNINIQTERITITNRGSISSSSGEPAPGQIIGSGGNINVTATDFIEIDPKGLINAKDATTGFVARTGSSSRAGDITLNTKNLIVRDGGQITVDASNNLGGQAGNITINASDSVELISSNLNQGSLISTSVFAVNDNVVAVGKGGELTINTGKLLLIKGVISSGTDGQGNAGNIFIFSNDEVVIDNGWIDSNVGSSGVGNGGDINIQTPKLTLINGGRISSSVFGALEDLPAVQGKGGRIRINATNAVNISGLNADGITSAILTETQKGAFGQGGDIIVNTDYFRLADKATISSATGNSSNAGNVTINARVVEVLNGGVLVTGTMSSGKAGDITINATDNITIFSNTGLTALLAGTTSSGGGGNISLFTTDFNLSATNSNLPYPIAVATSSLGEGVAGDINIVATGNFNANNGLVSASSEQSGGGHININARNIRLRNNSDIRTDLSGGNGKGGDISLTADIIIALEDSDILAFAPEGQGGDIRFNTRAVFSDSLYSPRQTTSDRNSLQSLSNNNRSDINATGTVSGNIIGVPDISFIQNGLTELENNPIDTNALIANSCIARSPKQEGTFIITGTGSLPHRPGEAAASSYPTGDVQSVTNNSAASSWKKGELIVEPQGVYRLANGDLVMSRECL